MLLEESARSVQPFREVGPYVPTPYVEGKLSSLRRDQTVALSSLGNGSPMSSWELSRVWSGISRRLSRVVRSRNCHRVENRRYA